MLHNMKLSIAVHAGLCLFIIGTRGLYAVWLVEVFYTVVSIAALYLLSNIIFRKLETKSKNLISLLAPSVLCLVFSSAAAIIYQLDVVNRYHYTYVTTRYQIVWTVAEFVNAPIIPFTSLLGRISESFAFPYGLLYTFFIPTLVLWLGLIRKPGRKVQPAPGTR